MQIGFSQPIELAWLEAAANFVADGLSPEDARARLDELLSHKIAVNSSSKRSSRNKRVTILISTWVKPKRELVGFRDHALSVLKLASGRDRTLVHYAMLIATYPFFALVANHVGRLLRLQDQCSMYQLKRRCREELGQRDTVSFAVTRVIRTFLDWGILAKGDKTGLYSIERPIEPASQEIVEILAEATLIASGETNALAEQILASPCLFLCRFPSSLISSRWQSKRFSLTTSEYGGFRVNRSDES
jgi:hypothetical protein